MNYSPKLGYAVIDTSIGSMPAVVVVNSDVQDLLSRKIFLWHLRIEVDLKHIVGNGMPTRVESDALCEFEDAIEADLVCDNNAVFFARITCNGARVIVYRVVDPEVANRVLQAHLNKPDPIREWDYHMQQDAGWDLARPELDLLSLGDLPR